MTKAHGGLRTLLTAPSQDDDMHLEEDLTEYFLKYSVSMIPAQVSEMKEDDAMECTGSTKKTKAEYVVDTEGGWASIYGLDTGRASDSFVHLTCALFSPRTWLKSGKWCNVKSETIRSRYFKCSLCGQKGATVGCFHNNCRQIVHVPCAFKQGWKPTLSVKAYFCATHNESIVATATENNFSNNFDISRGYEPLPVTKECCPCASCNTVDLSHDLASSSSNESVFIPNSRICEKSNSQKGAKRMIEVGIYSEADESKSMSSLANSHELNFLYTTENIDHDNINSWPSKVNGISYFCDCCVDDSGSCTCGINSACACAYQVFLSKRALLTCIEMLHSTGSPKTSVNSYCKYKRRTCV